MDIELKKIIVKEIKKGKTFSTLKELYAILYDNSNSLALMKIKSQIRQYWDFLENIIYISPNSDVLERIVDFNGDILDKVTSQWFFNEIKVDSLDNEIILCIILNKFNHDINLKCPFISFIGIKDNVSYRFTLQIVNRYPRSVVKIFIRIYRKENIPIASYNLSPSLYSKIKKQNIVVSGATGSGKTTFMKSILYNCEEDEHIVVIEDLNEIGNVTLNTTALCTQEIGQGMNQLLSNALRMSPNRLVLGEIRSNEITTFLLALNSGHIGSMATIHANSAVETLYRLGELMQIFGNFGKNSFSQIMKVIARNINIIIFMENKKVKEIIKVMGSSDKGAPFYEKLLSL